MNKIAAIGDRESLFAYEIIGADVYTADERNGRQIINFAVKSNYSVILVTELIDNDLFIELVQNKSVHIIF